MYFVFINLSNEDHLDAVLSLMTELEIVDGTVIDGVRQERILANDIPIFAGLLKSTTGDRPYNKNIVATVENKDTITELIRMSRKQGIDFSDEDTGKIVVWPCEVLTS